MGNVSLYSGMKPVDARVVVSTKPAVSWLIFQGFLVAWLMNRIYQGRYLTGEGGSLLGHASTINIKTISQSPVAILTLHKIYQHGNCFLLYLTVLSAVCYQTGIFLFF